MKNLLTKKRALESITNRGQLSSGTWAFLHWLKSNDNLLQRCHFVVDGSYAPSVLIVTEVDPYIDLCLLLNNPKYEGLDTLDEFLELVVANSISCPSKIARELFDLQGDLYISLDLNSKVEVSSDIQLAIEDNPFIAQELEKHKTKSQQEVSSIINKQLEVITLRAELDRALVAGDFDLCAEIKRKIDKASGDYLF